MKHAEEAVAFAPGFDQLTTGADNALFAKFVMNEQRFAHLIWMGLPKPGTAFDVGEHERHRALAPKFELSHRNSNASLLSYVSGLAVSLFDERYLPSMQIVVAAGNRQAMIIEPLGEHWIRTSQSTHH